MRYSLKDFQVTAADELMRSLKVARMGASLKKPQAVVLSSPTGSGKTVIITEMMERILRGHEGEPGDPHATFLWLSDSPELNKQSRNRIEDASDLIPKDRLIPVEHPFKDERFLPGRVYFLNTQKLTAASLLTKKGDLQERTIWEIVENTARANPKSFYLIIDEAHRGMRDAVKGQAAQTRAENARLTIVQKFVMGDPSIRLSPVPLIVGISATPERFQRVIESKRATHPVNVDPASVRISGIIKDRIKLAVAEKADEADWSMLAEAARKWARYSHEWTEYCRANQITPAVEPVLVVQVENGTDKVVTRTDLATCVKVLQDACGTMPADGFAHCFEDDGDVPAGNARLRKVDASAIQGDPSVRVVFFKTALSTGWDCPRAEVMMSFRKAVDSTLIAQLVGRMVRTPLSRRIESNDLLNSVSLALPHYDEDAVNAIVAKLQDPETGSTAEVVKEKELVTYRPAPDKADLFAALAKVPTYVVERPRRIAETARLIKLARLLSRHAVVDGAIEQSRRFVIERLLEQRDRLRKDAEWAARVEGSAKVRIKEFTIEYGEWKVGAEPESYYIDATDENIYALFERCGGILGEGLHDSYANRPEFRGDINTARLELFCILQDEKALKLVQQACAGEFDRLWKEHKDDIEEMVPATREKYLELRRRGGTAAPEPLTIVPEIEIKRESPAWDDHLYVDKDGKFGWAAGSWERIVLEAEIARPGFAGFLRNIPRKGLCIPYGPEDDESLYPDLITFRRHRSKVEPNILEPHGDHLADHLAKAQGLARYAKKHGEGFGRIEMIRVVDGKPERLDVQDEKVRAKVLKANTAENLQDLYEEMG